MKTLMSLFAVSLLASPLSAALLSDQFDNDPNNASVTLDGVLGAGEYAASYSNGGGSGFGGTLGAGSFYMDADANNLYIGFDPGAALNDLTVLWLDTRSGGFADADMNDQGDGGRRAVSNGAGNADDAFPVLPDFGIVFGGFGIVAFELTAGNTDNHLNFVSFDGSLSGNSETLVREFSLPLATLGNPTEVNWFAGYVADSGFGSNESFPQSPAMNGGANIGTDPFSPGYENYNRFTVVPEPGTWALGGLGLVMAGWMARRRANKQ